MNRLKAVREQELAIGPVRRVDANGKVSESTLNRSQTIQFRFSADREVEYSSRVSLLQLEGRRELQVDIRAPESKVAWRQLSKVDKTDAVGVVTSVGEWIDHGFTGHTVPAFARVQRTEGATLEETESRDGRTVYRIALPAVSASGAQVPGFKQTRRIWIDASSMRWIRLVEESRYDTDGAMLTRTIDYSEYDVSFDLPADALSAQSRRVVSGKLIGIPAGKAFLIAANSLNCESPQCLGPQVAGGVTDADGRYAFALADGLYVIRFDAPNGKAYWYPGVAELAKAIVVQVRGTSVQLADTSAPTD